MRHHNKQWHLSKEYLERIWFTEESRHNYLLKIGKITIIFCNENLYFSIKWDSKSRFFSNVNYKNIEEKLADIFNLYS